jgi:hypothetical protein
MFPKRGKVPPGLLLSALTIIPVPGVFRTMPRARGASVALKKLDTYKLGAASSFGNYPNCGFDEPLQAERVYKKNGTIVLRN